MPAPFPVVHRVSIPASHTAGHRVSKVRASGEPSEHRDEIVRQRRCEHDLSFCGWMGKGQAGGVQKRASARGAASITSVARVADDRMADRREMYAYLVCASRLEAKLQVGRLERSDESGEHAVMSACGPASGSNRHPSRIAKRPTDRRLDHTCLRLERTARERKVRPSHRARGKLGG